MDIILKVQSSDGRCARVRVLPDILSEKGKKPPENKASALELGWR